MLIRTELKNKDLISYAIQQTKGIGSLYIDSMEFKYISLWVSTVPIQNKHLEVYILTEDMYQDAISEHWIYIEKKHKNYFFYILY